MSEQIQVKPGDRVRMRKAHACGGDDWQVIQVGLDIRLKCLTGGRSVALPRPEFERRVKKVDPPS